QRGARCRGPLRLEPVRLQGRGSRQREVERGPAGRVADPDATFSEQVTRMHLPGSIRFPPFTAAILAAAPLLAADAPTAEGSFIVKLPPHRFASDLLPDSPFGVNTAFEPDTPDLEARLKAMEDAGIKWGRQDFTWKRIEKEKGIYDFSPYERLV